MKHYKGENEIHFYLFTDKDPRPYAPNINIHYHHTVHKCWRDGTNSKFRNILELEQEPCDYFYYFDADTNVVKDFTEWYIGDLVGGEHYDNRWNKEHPYDRNPLSRAYIPKDTTLLQMYFYGAFFGGKKDRVMEFCKINYENQKADALIHYEPIWNDESYINHYFHYNPPTIVTNEQFGFCISDKGGMDTRIISSNIDSYIQMVLDKPTKVFDIKNHTIVFDA